MTLALPITLRMGDHESRPMPHNASIAEIHAERKRIERLADIDYYNALADRLEADARKWRNRILRRSTELRDIANYWRNVANGIEAE